MMTLITNEDDRRFGAEFLEDILIWIRNEYEPGDIFDDEQLNDWAEENGWTEEV